MKLSVLIVLLINLGACKGILDIDKNQSKANINHNNNPGDKTKVALSDSFRQKDIKEDYLRDNFKLDDLRKIDWSNTENYGVPKNFLTLSKTESTNFIENLPILTSLGAKDKDYYVSTVKGDGNCWMTAGAQTVFYLIFNDDELFNEVIKQLPLLVEKYKDVPGFKDRFLYEELITLLKIFKTLSPQKRLVEFNKEFSYKLINYNFRALVHAMNLSKDSDALNEDIKAELKKILNDHQWSASRDIIKFFVDLLQNRPLIELFYNGPATFFRFRINKKYGSINFAMINDFFSDTLDEDDKELLKISLEDFKKAFNIEKKEDLLNSPLLQVIPEYINGNHYNLLINKSIATKFGYEN